MHGASSRVVFEAQVGITSLYGRRSGTFAEVGIAGHNLHNAGGYLKSHWSMYECHVKYQEEILLHASWAVLCCRAVGVPLPS